MTLLQLRIGPEGDRDERYGVTVTILGLWFGISRERATGAFVAHVASEWPRWRYWSSDRGLRS